jgi:hypothetical protein
LAVPNGQQALSARSAEVRPWRVSVARAREAQLCWASFF